MADIQPDRAMPVHRDILPALCLAGLSLSELRIALAVVRASWGWSETTTKHRLSQTMIERLSGVRDRKQMKHALLGLQHKGVIRKVSDYDAKTNTPAEWALVKDYESWAVEKFEVPWMQAAPSVGLDLPGSDPPRVASPPGAGPSEPPGVGTPQPSGGRTPGHEAQVEAQIEAQEIVASSTATPLLLPVEIPKAMSPEAKVWEYYCERRKQKGKMPASAAEQIRARINSTSIEDCILVVDWSHDAPTAAHLRDNDRGKDYTRWGTIFVRKNFDRYIEEAWDWRNANRPTSTPAQAADHDGWWAENGARWLRDAREFSMVWRQTKGEFGVDLRTVEDVVRFVYAGGTKQAAREPDVVKPPPPMDWLRPKVTPLALEIPWVEA
jgi:hypothetical protein